MRVALAGLLFAAVVSSPAYAGSDVVKFDGLQMHCVQAGKVKFGPNAKWSDCRVTRGRWAVTLDFIDMYQAQYCLAKGVEECDQRAFTLFGNRAYTPNANVMLQRIDPAGTEYDDPRLVQTKYGDILTLGVHFADGTEAKSYYRWQSGKWLPVESRAWLKDLARQLPKGEAIKAATVWPDADSMSAHAKLYPAGGAASDKTAKIELAVSKDRFTVKNVTLSQPTD